MKKPIIDLLKRGKKKGYVTYDSLNDAIGKDDIGEEDIEDIFRLLDSAGVDVVDSTDELTGKKKTEPPTPASVDRDEGVSFDPVEVYLGEMSRYPRLGQDEERKIIESIRTMKHELIGELITREPLRRYLISQITQHPSTGAKNGLSIDESEKSAASDTGTIQSMVGCREAEVLASSIADGRPEPSEPVAGVSPFSEETLSSIRRALANIRDLRRRLVEGHVRLVVTLAMKYQNRGVDFLDLVQEGNTGLISASEHFDPDTRQSFGSFATWWIRDAINRSIREQGKAYRVSRSISDRLRKLNRVRRDLGQVLEREPTPGEIAEELGIDEETVLQLMRVTRRSLRLDQPADTEDDATLGDVINLEKRRGKRTVDSRMISALNRIIDTLDEREANVIRLRFGIGDGIVHSPEQTANRLGISPSRVKELEERALLNLRHPSKRTELESPE